MQGKDLRIVFMGTPEFAVESLKALVENGYQVVGVITAPDKPAGRGQKLNESAVKQYAVSQGLNVLQPEKLKNPEFLEELRALQADLQIVVAFRMLPEVVWSMPRLGTFNLHGSLLPQYRGAAPINWAIINGDKETGVTTFLLSHEIDTGRILFREKTPISDNDNVGIIYNRLMEMGAPLVLKTVEALASGDYTAVEQDELANPATLKHAPKIFKDDCRINWSNSGEQIRNLIRGLSPYPTAWTELQDEGGQVLSMKIFESSFVSAEGVVPGEVATDGKKYFRIAAADGWLDITDLQLSGKKRMNVGDFLRGFHAATNTKAI